MSGVMSKLSLPRSMHDLATQAEAMLGAGPAFWADAAPGACTPEPLETAVKVLREAECAFCSALTARIHLMVQRQALDREAWEFIAQSRETLKTALGRQWSERWAPLGFESQSLSVPEPREDRLRLLRRLADYFRSHPEHQPEQSPSMGNRAEELLADLDNVSRQVEECRTELRRAAATRHRAGGKVRQLVKGAQSQLRRTLRKQNPRWLTFDLPLTAASHTAAQAPIPSGITSPKPPATEPFTPADASPRLALSATGAKPATWPTSAERLATRPRSAAPRLPRSGRAQKPPAKASHRQLEFSDLKLSSALAWLLPPSP
jgi:hypothetical protein